MTRRFAAIGVGALGRRHAQSLMADSGVEELFGVDPSAPARQQMIESAEAREFVSRGGVLHLFADVCELPRDLEFVVVATNADVRLAVICDLLKCSQPRFCLLEKVLFQSLPEYDECSALLAASQSRVYVNCPRRIYDVYRDLRNDLHGARVDLMTVTGGDWALGCNAVHFADLFAFLGGEPPTRYESRLDAAILPARRSGFSEFTGALIGRATGSLELRSIRGSRAATIVHVVADSRQWVILESLGTMTVYDGDRLVDHRAFTVPYQSQLTSRVANELFENGSTMLPTYEESARVHKPLLEAFLPTVRSHFGANVDAFPIT